MIETFKVSKPALQIQVTIADCLESLDNKIQLNRQTNQTLEQMAQTLFKSWFVDFDPVIDNALVNANYQLENLPADYPDELRPKAQQRLSALQNNSDKSNLEQKESNKTFPSEFEFNEQLGWVPKGWKFGKLNDLAKLKTSSINPNKMPNAQWIQFSLPAFDNKKEPTINLGSEIKSGKYKVPVSSVLVSKLNPHTPRVWLPNVVDIEHSVCSTEFMPFTPLKDEHRSYIFSLFSSEQIQTAMASRVTGTTGSHQRVKPKDISMLATLLPSDECINTYSHIAQAMFSKTQANRDNNTKLANLRDTLLPKLISGELTIPDAERVTSEI
jgi:type I restriction enzyme S subunit